MLSSSQRTKMIRWPDKSSFAANAATRPRRWPLQSMTTVWAGGIEGGGAGDGVKRGKGQSEGRRGGMVAMLRRRGAVAVQLAGGFEHAGSNLCCEDHLWDCTWERKRGLLTTTNTQDVVLARYGVVEEAGTTPITPMPCSNAGINKRGAGKERQCASLLKNILYQTCVPLRHGSAWKRESGTGRSDEEVRGADWEAA